MARFAFGAWVIGDTCDTFIPIFIKSLYKRDSFEFYENSLKRVTRVIYAEDTRQTRAKNSNKKQVLKFSGKSDRKGELMAKESKSKASKPKKRKPSTPAAVVSRKLQQQRSKAK